jgi:hypothetical protein
MLPDRTWRTLGDDCGGQPRAWVDERRFITQRTASLNTMALIETDTDSHQRAAGFATEIFGKRAVTSIEPLDRHDHGQKCRMRLLP